MRSEKEILEMIYDEQTEQFIRAKINKKFLTWRTLKEPKNDILIKEKAKVDIEVLNREKMVESIKELLDESGSADVGENGQPENK